jgi:hypothetical protein
MACARPQESRPGTGLPVTTRSSHATDHPAAPRRRWSGGVTPTVRPHPSRRGRPAGSPAGADGVAETPDRGSRPLIRLTAIGQADHRVAVPASPPSQRPAVTGHLGKPRPPVPPRPHCWPNQSKITRTHTLVSAIQPTLAKSEAAEPDPSMRCSHAQQQRASRVKTLRSTRFHEVVPGEVGPIVVPRDAVPACTVLLCGP